MIVKICLLFLGCLAASTSVIFIKTCRVDYVVIAGLRLVIAAVLLIPYLVRERRSTPSQFSFPSLIPLILPAGALAVHLISWTLGAKLTDSANSTIIVNLLPLVMPLLLLLITHERLTRSESWGTLIGMSGILILALYDLRLEGDHFQGDLVCLFSLVFLALYLTLAKKIMPRYRLWSYLVPVYLLAGLCSLIYAWIGSRSFHIPDTLSLISILGLVLIPTIIGHTLLNYSMTRLRGQIVSLANQSQFIFAGFMGYFFFGEIPQPHFYLASTLVVAGTLLTILKSSHTPEP
ncbi:MAG: DMT family transporter [Candidatus Delongbacteria bacterium]|mgnify:CR=1 FL=1|nr:DMT family transporter [Candidatus Delongbacteria bacterium]